MQGINCLDLLEGKTGSNETKPRMVMVCLPGQKRKKRLLLSSAFHLLRLQDLAESIYGEIPADVIKYCNILLDQPLPQEIGILVDPSTQQIVFAFCSSYGMVKYSEGSQSLCCSSKDDFCKALTEQEDKMRQTMAKAAEQSNIEERNRKIRRQREEAEVLMHYNDEFK